MPPATLTAQPSTLSSSLSSSALSSADVSARQTAILTEENLLGFTSILLNLAKYLENLSDANVSLTGTDKEKIEKACQVIESYKAAVLRIAPKLPKRDQALLLVKEHDELQAIFSELKAIELRPENHWEFVQLYNDIQKTISDINQEIKILK